MSFHNNRDGIGHRGKDRSRYQTCAIRDVLLQLCSLKGLNRGPRREFLPSIVTFKEVVRKKGRVNGCMSSRRSYFSLSPY